MKNFYLILIVTVCFFLTPTLTFACGNNLEKSCCKTEKNTSACKMKCCQKTENQKEKPCGGKCGHSNCTTTTSVNFSLISNFEIEFLNNNFDFSSEKQKFHQPETPISSGFTSIWLPPVIA
jgi:hypothetical protein